MSCPNFKTVKKYNKVHIYVYLILSLTPTVECRYKFCEQTQQILPKHSVYVRLVYADMFDQLFYRLYPTERYHQLYPVYEFQ